MILNRKQLKVNCLFLKKKKYKRITCFFKVIWNILLDLHELSINFDLDRRSVFMRRPRSRDDKN